MPAYAGMTELSRPQN